MTDYDKNDHKNGDVTMSVQRFFTSAGSLVRSRVEPLSGWSWNTAAACFIAARGHPPFIPAVLSIAAMVFISLSVYIYNDIIEAETDKLNPVKRHRPLPSGRVSRKDAMNLVYISGGCGLIMVFFANVTSFLFALLYFITLIAYSHPKIRIKNKFPLKELVLASCFPLTSLIGMYAASNSFAVHAFFAGVLVAVLVYSLEPVITDSIDIEEDTLTGVKTLASVLTWKQRTRLFVTGVVIVMVTIPLVYRALGFNVILPLVAVVGGLLFLGYAVPVMRTFEVAATIKARNASHVYFILLQVSFIVGSLHIPFL